MEDHKKGVGWDEELKEKLRHPAVERKAKFLERIREKVYKIGKIQVGVYGIIMKFNKKRKALRLEERTSFRGKTIEKKRKNIHIN